MDDQHEMTVDLIQKAVADYFRIKQEDILSERRSSALLMPRHIAMSLAMQLTTRGCMQIASLFERQDHTTVLHAVNKINELCIENPALSRALDYLKSCLQKNEAVSDKFRLSARFIQKTVADHVGVSIDNLISTRRPGDKTWRNVAVLLVKDMTSLTHSEIADYFNYKGTPVDLINSADRVYASRPELRSIIDGLKSQIQATGRNML